MQGTNGIDILKQQACGNNSGRLAEYSSRNRSEND